MDNYQEEYAFIKRIHGTNNLTENSDKEDFEYRTRRNYLLDGKYKKNRYVKDVNRMDFRDFYYDDLRKKDIYSYDKNILRKGLNTFDINTNKNKYINENDSDYINNDFFKMNIFNINKSLNKKDSKSNYLNKVEEEYKKNVKKREKEDEYKSSINELIRIDEIIYYIHADEVNTYGYITKNINLKKDYYKIKEAKKEPRTIDYKRKHFIFLTDDIFFIEGNNNEFQKTNKLIDKPFYLYKNSFRLKTNEDYTENEEDDIDFNHSSKNICKIPYKKVAKKSGVLDHFFINVLKYFYKFKYKTARIYIFFRKIFHYDCLEYPLLKGYAHYNFFEKDIKNYIKQLNKKNNNKEQNITVDKDFFIRNKYMVPFFVHNCIDINYNLNENGLIILSSILPFLHQFYFDNKLKEIRRKEKEVKNILNETNKKGFLEKYYEKGKKFLINNFFNFEYKQIKKEQKEKNEIEEKFKDKNNDYINYLKKYYNISIDDDYINDIIYPAKFQMMFINFKNPENNNYEKNIGTIEIKDEKIQSYNLILGYSKKRNMKYTDIFASSVLKNIKRKYPNMIITDENPKYVIMNENNNDNYLLNENESILKEKNKESVLYNRSNSNEINLTTNNLKDINEHHEKQKIETDKIENVYLSDVMNYVSYSPAQLLKSQYACEYVTCLCFDNNTNSNNIINNFVIGYNTGKVEYIIGKIEYSNINRYDLNLGYTRKNRNFSYELYKRIYLNGSIVKIGFASNGFYCLILTFRNLYICSFFHFCIFEIQKKCFNSQIVNFLWINNNSYAIFNDKGYIYIYEKNFKDDHLNNFLLIKTYCIHQPIYFNSICDFNLTDNSIYLYTGCLEKKKMNIFKNKKIYKCLKKKKKNIKEKSKTEINDLEENKKEYFYKYIGNFLLIDLNNEIKKKIIEDFELQIDNLNKNKGEKKEDEFNILNDPISDIGYMVKQIKIIQKCLENNISEDEDLRFEKMLSVNLNAFNKYISNMKTVNKQCCLNISTSTSPKEEIDDEEEIEKMIKKKKKKLYSLDDNELLNKKNTFIINKIIYNYFKNLKKYLLNIRNENILNILLPRYYSNTTPLEYENFVNVRYFTLEKSNYKHLIVLDTQTDHIYIYEILKNVYLDEEIIKELDNIVRDYCNDNILFMKNKNDAFENLKKNKIALKKTWKIYNGYIFINTKNSLRYIKYNLLYILKTKTKIYFPLHIKTIKSQSKFEFFLFIKWAILKKNVFICPSHNTLNKISKKELMHIKRDNSMFKALEQRKNIFVYETSDEEKNERFDYMKNNNNNNNLTDNIIDNNKNPNNKNMSGTDNNKNYKNANNIKYNNSKNIEGTHPKLTEKKDKFIEYEKLYYDLKNKRNEDISDLYYSNNNYLYNVGDDNKTIFLRSDYNMDKMMSDENNYKLNNKWNNWKGNNSIYKDEIEECLYELNKSFDDMDLKYKRNFLDNTEDNIPAYSSFNFNNYFSNNKTELKENKKYNFYNDFNDGFSNKSIYYNNINTNDINYGNINENISNRNDIYLNDPYYRNNKDSSHILNNENICSNNKNNYFNFKDFIKFFKYKNKDDNIYNDKIQNNKDDLNKNINEYFDGRDEYNHFY